jgi:anti-sigma B factor antagonist
MADPRTEGGVADADGDAVLIDYEEALVFSLTGVIDAQALPGITQHLQSEMTPDRPALVVNLSGVTFIDSSAIGLLFDLARRSHRRRLRYAIVAPSDQPVRSVLMLAGIDVVALLVESVPEALERVAEPE